MSSDHDNHNRLYLTVWSGLLILTGGEIVLAYQTLSVALMLGLLLLLSFGKTGLIVAYLNGYIHQALMLGIGSGGGKNTAIGIGMWLGLIMAYNVWFVIWPNQKRVLGLVDCTSEEKAKSARTAMLFSRTNTLLSLPMLLSMVAAQNLY